jgi:ectoine hydroxylase-related dioxygenase (phytanoyl-CoA dioxygenase family)
LFAKKFEKAGLSPVFSLLQKRDAPKLVKQIIAEAGSVPLTLPTDDPHYYNKVGRSFPWFKSMHSVSPTMYKLATSKVILDRVSELLGPDVLLWGSQVIRQVPEQKHRWHADIEHLHWDGVTVWVAMENVPSRTMAVISGSHQIYTNPQEIFKITDIDSNDNNTLAQIAKLINPKSKLEFPKVQVGEFIIFSGKTWHATQNRGRSIRSALIFQYCRPDAKVRIPMNYSPPIIWHTSQPPCCLVRGIDESGVNELIDSPVALKKTGS